MIKRIKRSLGQEASLGARLARARSTGTVHNSVARPICFSWARKVCLHSPYWLSLTYVLFAGADCGTWYAEKARVFLCLFNLSRRVISLLVKENSALVLVSPLGLCFVLGKTPRQNISLFRCRLLVGSLTSFLLLMQVN